MLWDTCCALTLAVKLLMHNRIGGAGGGAPDLDSIHIYKLFLF